MYHVQSSPTIQANEAFNALRDRFDIVPSATLGHTFDHSDGFRYQVTVCQGASGSINGQVFRVRNLRANAHSDRFTRSATLVGHWSISEAGEVSFPLN